MATVQVLWNINRDSVEIQNIESFVDTLVETIQKKNFNYKLPALIVNYDGDGKNAVSIEWIFHDCRVGATISLKDRTDPELNFYTMCYHHTRKGIIYQNVSIYESSTIAFKDRAYTRITKEMVNYIKRNHIPEPGEKKSIWERIKEFWHG